MNAPYSRSHWLASYHREWLRADVVAGLTTAAVVIPQAMAYATIAGLTVEIGLYVALMPMLVYALLGTSRPLSVSSTSTIAILTAHQLALVVGDKSPAEMAAAAATLALLTGVFLVLAGVARPGLRRQFYFRSRIDRLQKRHRVSHRIEPGAETARRPHRQQ